MFVFFFRYFFGFLGFVGKCISCIRAFETDGVFSSITSPEFEGEMSRWIDKGVGRSVIEEIILLIESIIAMYVHV